MCNCNCSREELTNLKEGEETKTKEYHALCVAWGVDVEKLKRVSEKAPLTINQKTPVRVLHRRPVATRPKKIHWLESTVINKPRDINITDEGSVILLSQIMLIVQI